MEKDPATPPDNQNVFKQLYEGYLPAEERYEADRVMAHSGASRASMESTDGESILAERAALTNAGSAYRVRTVIT